MISKCAFSDYTEIVQESVISKQQITVVLLVAE